jgi:transcriptional regulator of acetoin/glycerol metabolism
MASLSEHPESVPYDREPQSRLAGAWRAFVGAGREPRALQRADGVRGVVRDSWQRSAIAAVAPTLGAAPVAWSDDAVHREAERSDWFALARGIVAQHRASRRTDGHIVALFDAEARMLAAEGDDAALEGLAAINFRPGGDWHEAHVGTNGPGTALATGHPTHIVGAEHFCEQWHAWHCAAVPLHDPVTQAVIGALDLSGFRESAHPHTFDLALALGVAIEQALTAREFERRFAVLHAFQALVAAYPGDAIIAFDRGGHVLGTTANVPEERVEALGVRVRVAGDGLRTDAGAAVSVGDRRAALWFPVMRGDTVIGGSFVLETTALPRGSEGIPFRADEVRVYARRFFAAGARDLGLLRLEVEPAVYDAMQAYHWPGNVRELKHVVRRVLQATNGVVQVQHLPHVVREAYLGGADALSSAIDEEDARLIQVVRDSATMAAAAEKLGITRSTLYRRMERFGLKPKRVLGRD